MQLKNINKLIHALLIATAPLLPAALFSLPVLAKKEEGTYPEKVIRVIVPNGAGGSTDKVSRLFVRELNNKLPVGLAVINIKGGGTSKGAQKAARSKPDGYTLLSTHQALLTSSALKINRLGPESLTPIAQIAHETYVIAVSPDSPIRNLDDLFKASNEGVNGKRIRVGVNPGAANHFFFLKAILHTKADVVFVPSGGGAKTLKQILGGHLDTSIFAVSEVHQLIKSKKLHALAVFDTKTHDKLSGVSTARQQGHDIVIKLNYTMYAPAGTEQSRIKVIADALGEIVKQKSFVEDLQEQSINPDYKTGAALQQTIDKDYAEMKIIANHIKQKAQENAAKKKR